MTNKIKSKRLLNHENLYLLEYNKEVKKYTEIL